MYPPEPHILDWLRSFILPTDRVLDVGSGEGRHRDIGAAEYYSLDVMPQAEPDYLLDLNTDDLPVDRFFDVILCIDVLEHIEKERSREILRQAYGLAKRAVVVFVPLVWNENRGPYEDKNGFYYQNEFVLHRSEWGFGDFNINWNRVLLPSTMEGYFAYILKEQNDIVLVGQVCMYNEVEKGNLARCLDNLSKYCDHIVVYDDHSTDDSVAVAKRYGCHVIEGHSNNQMEERKHKQLILEKSLRLGATHLFWLDCDEVLERDGTEGGLRRLCASWPDDVDAYSFRESNLWRSQTYVRVDSLFDKARFVRLWKVVPGIKLDTSPGVHLKLYPDTIKTIEEAPYSVIHYGFCDYKAMMVKIGVQAHDEATLHHVAHDNWILDERQCSCYRMVDEMYPSGTLPPDIWQRPHSKKIVELVTYDKVPEQQPYPMADMRAYKEWSLLHSHLYHGSENDVHVRNKNVFDNKNIDPVNRACIFKFDPSNKVIFDVACGGGWFMLDCLINGASKIYGFEIYQSIIDHAESSFKSLAIPDDQYQFINMSLPMAELPQADIIYCIAMFMHIPWWQGKRYLQWFYDSLKSQGEAFIQFYQHNGTTMFWNGIDSIKTITLEYELERLGFEVLERDWYLGNTEVPLWRMYRCKKG